MKARPRWARAERRGRVWVTRMVSVYRYQHVQAIIVAIDQYAEAATGNRDFFLTRPPGLRRGSDIP
jgi:hypothetical protein